MRWHAADTNEGRELNMAKKKKDKKGKKGKKK
jgi:hypothetical protein